MGALALATVVGLVVLWPGDVDQKLGQGLTGPSERAEIQQIKSFPCSGFQTQECRDVVIKLETGPDEGRRATSGSARAVSTPTCRWAIRCG